MQMAYMDRLTNLYTGQHVSQPYGHRPYVAAHCLALVEYLDRWQTYSNHFKI